jgi:hypothetical protein
MPAASIDALLWVGKLEAVTADGDMRGLAAALARVLRPGGRLYLTFNVGQPPIALDTRQARAVLGALRGAPSAGAAGGPLAATADRAASSDGDARDLRRRRDSCRRCRRVSHCTAPPVAPRPPRATR